MPRAREPSALGAGLLLSALFGLLSAPEALAHNCLFNLPQNANVVANPPGYNYDIHFWNSPGPHFTTPNRAGWVRDGISQAHNLLIAPPYNFQEPFFGFASFAEDACIFNFKPSVAADAPRNRIRVESTNLQGSNEPSTRATMAHELLHHIQYASIAYVDWPAWGSWTVEGTGKAIEDKLYFDIDFNPSSGYVSWVNNLLGNTNAQLFNRGYSAALWWGYLQEQLGTPTNEPSRGAVLLAHFWNLADGIPPDSIGVLRDTLELVGSDRGLRDLFLDFSISNYTHDLNFSGVPNSDRYSYFDESFAGGGTPYNAVTTTPITSQNVTQSASVTRYGATHFEVTLPGDASCEAIGFFGQAQPGRSLSWAAVGVKAGNNVTDILRGRGNTFYRAFINDRTNDYKKLGLVVVGLNKAANFDYAYGTGAISGEVKWPLPVRPVKVGAIGSPPQRFQVHLLVQGPASLTPDGSGPVSLKGLDPTLFDFSLVSATTQARYTPTVFNGEYVGGQYWLRLEAPEITNDLDGKLYDLEVCICGEVASCGSLITSVDSILYEDEILDEMLTIDHSGSMDYPTPAENSKMEAAENAARMYVSAAQNDDFLGVTIFSGDDTECNPDAEFTPLTGGLVDASASRVQLRSDVSNITASGFTSIGDGIVLSRDELIANAANPTDTLGIVLLSDGMGNEEDFWSSANSTCGTPAVQDSFDPDIPGFAAHIRIDTMAFGADANQGALQQIADLSEGLLIPVDSNAPGAGGGARAGGGTGAGPGAPETLWPGPEVLEVPNRLANAFRTIQEDTRHHDRLHFASIDLTSGVPEVIVVSVTEAQGGGVEDATFAINWHLASVATTVELRDPNGVLITGATPGWTVENGTTNRVYLFANVLPVGAWEITLTAPAAVQATVGLSGRILRGVELDPWLSQVREEGPVPECNVELYHYLRGLPVNILANVTDTLGGVPGLSIEARVVAPFGNINRLTLYDDGAHEDGVAGDGLYAALYTRTPYSSRDGVPDFPLGPPTGDWGSYTVDILAFGTSNWGESFFRFEQRGFHVHEFADGECDPDLDNDGLPDRWERLYGLDPGDASDALTDDDNDGLINRDEFFAGTLPFDADTDDGGESDGSEVSAGRDPLYDQDDLLPAILDYGIVTHVFHMDVHLPKPETNILHFPVASQYQRMEVWRSNGFPTSFSLLTSVDLNVEISGVYYDEGLTNGVTYDYYLVAEGLSGSQTAPTDVFSGTPNADSLPPEVSIVLNNGWAVADSPNLVAKLVASPDTTDMRLSQNSSMTGGSFVGFATPTPITVASGGPAPYPATVFTQVQDSGGNFSLVMGDTIVIDENGDADGDGTPNSVDADDDNDGLPDTDEVSIYGTDPMSADSDGDGLTDRDEIFLYGTNPLLWDTDGDGFSDSDELAQGTDPTDPASHPVVYLPVMGGAGVLMLALSGLGWAMLTRRRPGRRS
jgi:hypothetical protein